MNKSPAQSDIREMICDARRAAGLTEKEVNNSYFRQMTDKGGKPPRAIMTKVRDRRKKLELSKTGAQVLAEILKLDPATLLPAKSSQEELPIEHPAPNAEKTVDPTPRGKVGNVEEEGKSETENNPGREPTRPREKTQGAGETTEAKTQIRKSRIVTGIVENDDGLLFLINMSLEKERYQRLVLSVPEYMMETRIEGEKIHCRAQVPIFPYQAELIMRAIFGVK